MLRLSLYDAIILGVVQGLTEFLPVSSSGHLAIAQYLLGLPSGTLTFDVMVHLGTLIAVFVALRQEVALLFSALRPGTDPQARLGRRLVLLLAVGTIPAVVVGLILKDHIEAFFASLYVVGAMLLATGTILFLAERADRGDRSLGELRSSDALFIGCGQALAIMPGLSRSGTTISAGFLRGVTREDAARFSFLLAIPTILGAAVLELPNVPTAKGETSTMVLVAGLFASAVTGYLAISFLVQLIRRGRLLGFACYTWCAGLLTLLLAYLQGH